MGQVIPKTLIQALKLPFKRGQALKKQLITKIGFVKIITKTKGGNYGN